MKTISFIGSDKNAGKTTALNLFYQKRYQRQEASRICLASIGINGEDVDTYEHRRKPSIRLHKGSYFVTAAEHLPAVSGRYETLYCFNGPGYSKTYVLGRVLLECDLILEGPNERNTILKMKQVIASRTAIDLCLLDGSIDRQFIGNPEVSDEICFALLLSERPEQLQKAGDLLASLRLPQCTPEWRKRIEKVRNDETRSLYFDQDGTIIFRGQEVPFMDDSLRQVCLEQKQRAGILYLNGALSKSLYRFLSPFKKLTIVLDSFTGYQNISTDRVGAQSFEPGLQVLKAVPVKYLFVKQEQWKSAFRPPIDIPAVNLFRDDLDELRI